LEKHDVNASLKVKLKCLVFIPVIYQTYSDIKSFVWEYVFCVFNKLSAKLVDPGNIWRVTLFLKY